MAELWDLYNDERRPIGKTHERGKPLQPGQHHIVVAIWTIVENSKILLTKRHPNLKYGGYWECTGGCVRAGEDSITGACRELYEETGISVSPAELIFLRTIVLPDRIVDTYAVKKDIVLSELVLQEIEVADAKLVTLSQLEEMCNNGEISPELIERLVFYKQKLIELIA